MTNTRHVSASQVAELGTCEYKVMLEARHGKRPTAEQAVAMRAGTERHARFHEQGQRGREAQQAKPWCFVASAVYGDSADETQTLRRFRDSVLKRSMVGRAIIRHYYRRSPAVARTLKRSRLGTRVVKCALDLLLPAIRRVMSAEQ